jgi:hypothetical protein
VASNSQLAKSWNTAETAIGNYLPQAKIVGSSGQPAVGPAFKGYYNQAMAPAMKMRNIALYGGLAALAGGSILGIRALIKRNRRKREAAKAQRISRMAAMRAYQDDDPRLRFVYSGDQE